MVEQYENNFSTQLNGSIDDDDTTLTVDNVPVNMTGGFRIKIEDEIIRVGAVSGSTFTGCTRGVEDTTAASHADNAIVTHVLTAEALKTLGATYIDGIEAAAPATPSSGTARLYVKSDGRWYSKDDGGTEYGPFSSGGADLSGYRLTDSNPDFEDLPIGTYGDDFEYTDKTDLLSVWDLSDGASGTMPGTDIFVGGSDVSFFGRAISGRGLVRTGLTLPADFEVGALFTMVGSPGAGMMGIGISNGTTGIQTAHYGGPMYYILTNNTYTYVGGLGGGGSAEALGPIIVTLRRLSGNWRVRFSNNDMASWTESTSSVAHSVSGADRITITKGYTNETNPRCHKIVYGVPDLGLG